MAVRFLSFESKAGWKVAIKGKLSWWQSSGSRKSNGESVRLAWTKSGLSLERDSLSSFCAFKEGIV